MSDTPPPASPPPDAPQEGGHLQLLHWLLVAASLVSLRDQARAAARHFTVRAGLTGTALLLWATAAAFALAAFAAWLSTYVGLPAALAIVAASLAVVALVLHFIAARMAHHRKAWSWQTPFSELNETLKSGGVDEAAVGALMLAAVAGLILGFRSGKH